MKNFILGLLKQALIELLNSDEIKQYIINILINSQSKKSKK